MAKSKKNKLTLTLEFDLADESETFGNFCKALFAGGFENEVRAMAGELLKEAERRKLPVAAELRKAVPHE